MTVRKIRAACVYAAAKCLDFYLLSLEPVESPGLGTLRVEGKRLYYDPDVVAEWDERVLGEAIYHEWMHMIAQRQR